MATLTTLTQEEAASSGFTHKIVITYADVAALTSGTAYSIYPTYATTATKTLLLVDKVATCIKTAFASAGNTITLVATIGDGTTANLFQASTTWKTAGWIVGANTTSKILAGDIIKFTPTAGTEAITTLTAGEAHIFLNIVDGPTMTK
jgi:hypothetical protein